MLKNFILVALRNFRRQPGYTALNVLGLTLGVSATLFILLFLQRELSYDRHHAKAERIYRISSDITETDDAFKWAVTQVPLGPELKQNYPEVEEYVRFIPSGRTQFEYEQRSHFDEKTFIVDSTVFDVFSFQFIQGDPTNALNEPNSVVLSQSLAESVFGRENPMDKTVEIDNERKLQVRGVYRDMPPNSHLIANAMITASSEPNIRAQTQNPGAWGGFGIYTYALLHPNVRPEAFEAKLDTVIEQHVATIFDQFNIKVKYVLLPLLDIHLKSDFEGEPEPLGQMSFIYIFGAVALFMLLLACINYMNLATARSARRALEVGMRKVLGSTRGQLIRQFLSESVILALIALVLSFGLVYALTPWFNSLFDLTLDAKSLFTPQILTGMALILLLVGILGGSYPAFYLSAFQPVTVMQGSVTRGKSNAAFRKGLVILQFVISIFMLIGTGIIYDQMNYVRNKELGFDKEHILTFSFTDRSQVEKWPVIRNALLQEPNIRAVSTASTTPSQGTGKQLFNIETADGTMDQRGIDNYGVDFDFFPTMGMEIIKGRNFSPEYGTDSTLAVLVNEAMVERMGWGEDPIGRRVQFGSNDTLPVARVIGVVKDFHQRALYDPIEPLMFRARFSNRIVHAKIAGNVPAAINRMEQIWTENFPDAPFEYRFVDEAFLEMYQADQVRARIFTLFSIVMIIIACLGLLGLASYTAAQRTKEIGIRKIVGASSLDIVRLLTQNFLLLVAVAAIPAFIAAWYFMSKWLDTFAYHTNMNYLLFAAALLLTALITLLTTSYHAMKAARGIPVEALRSE